MDEQKYCRLCGAANPTDASFCIKCGKTFARAQTFPPTLTSTAEAAPTLFPPPPRPTITIAPNTSVERGNSSRLRPFEISAGLVILVLSSAVFIGVSWAATIAFLAIALIILGIVYLIRIYEKGTARRLRLQLTLSVLAILVAVLVLAYQGFSAVVYIATALSVLGLGWLFAGIASALRSGTGGRIAGVVGIFVGFIVLVFPNLGNVAVASVLLSVSLFIFGLELLVSGIKGRSISSSGSQVAPQQ